MLTPCCSNASDVLFFIELGRRRIWITGVTAHRHAAWVTQQARNVTSDFADADITVKFLVRIRDTKYVSTFDEVFEAEGSQILRTPYRTPNANAFAERFGAPLDPSVSITSWS